MEAIEPFSIENLQELGFDTCQGGESIGWQGGADEEEWTTDDLDWEAISNETDIW